MSNGISDVVVLAPEEPAVVGDVEVAVGAERGAVGAAAEIGEPLDRPAAVGLHAGERSRRISVTMIDPSGITTGPSGNCSPVASSVTVSHAVMF